MKAIASLAVALSLAAPVALVACGGGDGGGSDEPSATTTAADDATAGVNRVDLSSPASGALVFEPDTATAQAGDLTIVWDNEAKIKHNICLEDARGKPAPLHDQRGEFECSSPVANQSITGSITVKPGEYTYYCSVDGHREAGMEGTLTVE